MIRSMRGLFTEVRDTRGEGRLFQERNAGVTAGLLLPSGDHRGSGQRGPGIEGMRDVERETFGSCHRMFGFKARGLGEVEHGTCSVLPVRRTEEGRFQ